MNYKKVISLIMLFFLIGGCGAGKKNDSVSEAENNLQLKLGIQEVHFSQISEVEGWGFADIDEAKALFDYLDDLKISRFRYTMFWSSTELYSKNNFNWSRHDDLINYLTGKGIKLTVTLFGDHYLYDNLGSSPYPGNQVADYWDAWLNYVGKCVTRYGDRVDRWEIWNEPDLSDGTNGIFWKPVVSAADFTDMIKMTSQKIKSVHPGAKVVMGGVTNFNGYRSFLESSFDLGILDYIDEIGIHLYRLMPEGPFNLVPDTTVDINPDLPGIQSPSTFSEDFYSLRSFIDSYKADFPLRNTEEGVYIGTSAREDYSQLKYLTRTILIEHSLGINEITCFRLRSPRRSDHPDTPAGLAAYNESLKFPGIIDQNDDGSFTPRPAYYGIKNMAKYLVNPDTLFQRSLILTSGGDTVRVHVYSKNGRPVIAYWIEEAIDNTEKAVRYISITINGIGNHSYKVIDIKDDSSPATGSYSVSGSGITFSSLPATDYPFILSVD